MLILKIIDSNSNSYYPQEIKDFNFQKIHYGGYSQLSCILEENPSFQNHKVELFNNVHLYYYSKLVWQGYITEFQRNYKDLNYNLKASGLLIDLMNKRIKKTYVLDDIGDFKNWSEKNNKESSEILYGYSSEKDDKGIRINLLQRNYVAEEDAVFEIKIDENIERIKGRTFLNLTAQFTTKLVTLDENHSNPNTEWSNVGGTSDADRFFDISNIGINKRYLQFRVECTANVAITKDRYFSQLSNIKLLTSDEEINASFVFKDLLQNYTQKLNLDTSLIQDCYNSKNMDLCESLDGWLVSDAGKIALSLENAIIKEGNSSLKAIVSDFDSQFLLKRFKLPEEIYTFDFSSYTYDFAADDGKWTLNNAQIAGGVLDIIANDGFGDRHPDINWPSGKDDSFEIQIDFKQDSAVNEGAEIKLYLEGNTSPISFDIYGATNKMRIHYKGADKATATFVDDTAWHTVKIRKVGSTYYFSIDGGTIINWNYGVARPLDFIRLTMNLCTGDFDNFIFSTGDWLLSNAAITSGVLDITVASGYGQRSPDDDWNLERFENFEIDVDFKQDSTVNEGARVYIYLVGDAEAVMFHLKGRDNLLWIYHNGNQVSTAFVDDTDWHTFKIRRTGANYFVKIDDGAEIGWNYGTARAVNYIRLAMETCTGDYDNFIWRWKAPWNSQNIQDKNLIKFWLRSTIADNILKAKFSENERFQCEPNWTCKYEGNAKPQDDYLPWTQGGVDYGSVGGGILTINKTAGNTCIYYREDVGHNVRGNTLIATVKVTNVAKTTYLSIQDGIARVLLAIYATKIEDWNDATNYYTIDMTNYHALWLTMKNNFWVLYIDGSLALVGETQTSVEKGFKFGMDASANLGISYWDSVYYFNERFVKHKKMEKTISIDVADTWEEKVIDLNSFPIETRDNIKYIKLETLANCTLYLDWIKADFELTSAYYRDRTAPLNILEDVLAYQDYEWTITKDRKVKFFEVDRDEIDYICPIKNLVFEENSVSYFNKIYLVYFDEMMKRQEVELTDENSEIPFDKEHVIGLGGISDVGAKAIGEAQFDFHKKPRYQLNCAVDNFVFDKNGGIVESIEIEPNKNIKFIGIADLPIFRVIKTNYANGICTLTLETEEETITNITKSIIEVL